MVASTEDLEVHGPDQTHTCSVYNHSLVTKDSDALKFSAAASFQLIPPKCEKRSSQPLATPTDTRLIISPYNDDLHLLDLTTLDTPNRLLAKALTSLKPIRDDYGTAEYTRSFNWSFVLRTLRDLAAAEGYEWKRQSFYVVVFRSKLKSNVNTSYLHDLDFHSLAEATVSGGLLKYWFGTKNGELRNLATCVWRSREDARRGGTGPWHVKARTAARQLYQSIDFKTLEWTIWDGAEGGEFKPWNHGVS